MRAGAKYILASCPRRLRKASQVVGRKALPLVVVTALLLTAVLFFYASLQSQLDSLYSHERSAFIAQAGHIQPGQTKSDVFSQISIYDEIEPRESSITFSLIPEERWTRHWGVPWLVNILFIHVHFDDDELVSRVQRGDG